jgi:hypothetical protein
VEAGGELLIGDRLAVHLDAGRRWFAEGGEGEADDEGQPPGVGQVAFGDGAGGLAEFAVPVRPAPLADQAPVQGVEVGPEPGGVVRAAGQPDEVGQGRIDEVVPAGEVPRSKRGVENRPQSQSPPP